MAAFERRGLFRQAIGRTSRRVVPPPSGPADPDFANVELLCNFDGVDAATGFTEQSNNAAVATFAGNAQLDTAEKKFGSASLLVDGTGDHITFPNNAGFTPVDGADWTAEMHIRLNSASGNEMIYSTRKEEGGTDPGISIYSSSAQKLTILVHNASASILSISGTHTAFATNTWYHIAVVREEGVEWRLYVDGVEVTTGTETGTLSASAGLLYLGQDNDQAAPNEFDGWVDNVRVTAGVARYPAGNFTPPTESYPTN